jgi:dihydroorotate dehydrogenase (NAD+) catalytic subunit
MSIRITRTGKNSIVVDTPVMNAAGTLGFGDGYRDLLDYGKLGALVTNPVTYQPREAAHGTRVVPLEAGVLVHTGLPNPGIRKVLDTYSDKWDKLPATLRIIVHVVVVTNVDDVRRCIIAADHAERVDGIELGLSDEISVAEVEWYLRAVRDKTEKPLIARLPFGATVEMARACEDAGAHALTVAAAPRGVARDGTGRLVTGRLYSPMVRPLALRAVGQIARRVQLPVIGAGGIHTPQDARDFLEAGAAAVQVDSAVWIEPKRLEWIARDLGGLVLTQPANAMPDDWFPGMGMTAKMNRADPPQDAPDKPDQQDDQLD